MYIIVSEFGLILFGDSPKTLGRAEEIAEILSASGIRYWVMPVYACIAN